MRVTIKDIAKQSGLSITTVSMVLNGKENRIAPETKKRVLQVAKEMNYRPNQLAVSMITKRTRTLGLIVPDISNLFFAELAKGAEQEGDRMGYNIILCNTNDKAEKDMEYMNVLADRSIDAVIYAMSSQLRMREMVSIIDAMQTPVVLVDRFRVGEHFSSVAIDHRLGGYTATQHLISNGHRHIGCITGPLNIHTAKLRFEGYKAALEDNGIPYREDYVREGDYHIESGELAATELLQKEITAIFSCNDMMAYGIYKVAAKSNKKIPEDISVVGFDNISFSEIMEAPLTTVSQPTYEIGKAAVRKAVDLIENGAVNESIVFDPSLVVRKSVKKIAEGAK